MRPGTIAEGVYGAALMALTMILNPVLRRWHLRWGATDDELRMALPGDPPPEDVKLSATHAISVRASPDAIWAWLVQIGADRGGFYSYDFLENLVGCKLKSANRIIPQFQELRVGDSISLHPKAAPLEVKILIPNQSMVLGKVWGFHLFPGAEGGTTRLIVRARGGYEPRIKNRFLNFIAWHVLYEPIHFVMERRMMKGIKKLAESDPLGCTRD